MQDDTGIIFLDYHQPIPLWNFFFGLLRRGGYDGREVEVVGWYRRNPVPYLEIKSIQVRGQKARTCYTYLGKYFFAGLFTVIGLMVMLGVRS
jgi:hypothetical protein